jgi:hypothetical protein
MTWLLLLRHTSLLVEQMELLDFPPEILQHIITMCSHLSTFILCMTCRYATTLKIFVDVEKVKPLGFHFGDLHEKVKNKWNYDVLMKDALSQGDVPVLMWCVNMGIKIPEYYFQSYINVNNFEAVTLIRCPMVEPYGLLFVKDEYYLRWDPEPTSGPHYIMDRLKLSNICYRILRESTNVQCVRYAFQSSFNLDENKSLYIFAPVLIRLYDHKDRDMIEKLGMSRKDHVLKILRNCPMSTLIEYAGPRIIVDLIESGKDDSWMEFVDGIVEDRPPFCGNFRSYDILDILFERNVIKPENCSNIGLKAVEWNDLRLIDYCKKMNIPLI